MLDPSDEESETDIISEYYQANNVRSVLFSSLLEVYGDPVTISTEQTNEDGNTEAVVTLKNNSLASTATGNLIVSLRDDSGNILESMQCYNKDAPNNGLISLNGEETASRVFDFSKAGASLAVSYSSAVLDEENNAEITSLSMSGIPLELESGKTEYEVAVEDMADTFVSVTTVDPDALVTVNGVPADLGNITVDLRYGNNIINIEVTAVDGVSVKNYKVTVKNTRTIFSDNTNFSVLTLNEIPVELEDGKLAYEVTTTDLAGISVYAATEDPDARVAVNSLPAGEDGVTVPLNYGKNTINVEVTASDTVAVKNYTITVTNIRTIFNADLAALTLNGAPADLEDGKTEYEITVMEQASAYIYTATEDPDSTCTINGILADSGDVRVQLGYGLNTIKIRVTGADGVLVKNYTLTVNNVRTIFNAELSSLSLIGIPLELEKGKTEYEFTVVDYEYTYVYASTEDPQSSVTVNGFPMKKDGIPVILLSGINVIRIKVTGADGVLVKNYTITITNNRTAGNGVLDNKANGAEFYYHITDEAIAKLIKEASGNNNRILIKPTFNGSEKKFVFILSGHGISSIAASGALLSLDTPILNLILSHASIAEIARRNCKEISIIIEITDGILSISILADGIVLDTINGNILASLYAASADSGIVAAIVNADGTTDIIKMSAMSNGLLAIPLKGSAVFKAISNAHEFSDIKKHWALRHIDFVTSRNLFQGTGGTQFSPDVGMTRGMIVTVLGRLSGIIPDQYDVAGFSDVDKNAYYARYVEWAASNGIVQGDGKGRFFAGQEVTREQLAVILYNYVQYMGLSLAQTTTGTETFADEGEISSYARNGVAAMQRAGIINGKGGNRFDPKGKASRAEVAAMLERLVSNIMW